MHLRNFYIKAILIGAVGASVPTFIGYSDDPFVFIDMTMFLTTLTFAEHFKFVLMFWLVFESSIQIKNWLLGGFLGSLLYALSFLIIRGLIFPEQSLIYLFDKIIMGIMGAIPIWLVLRKNYSKAHLWILANTVGYMVIGISPTLWKIVMDSDSTRYISFHAFFIYLLLPKSLWTLTYSIFGLILGVSLTKITQNGIDVSYKKIK